MCAKCAELPSNISTMHFNKILILLCVEKGCTLCRDDNTVSEYDLSDGIWVKRRNLPVSVSNKVYRWITRLVILFGFISRTNQSETRIYYPFITGVILNLIDTKYILYVKEVVTRPKILNRTILSKRVHVTYNYFAL